MDIRSSTAYLDSSTNNFFLRVNSQSCRYDMIDKEYKSYSLHRSKRVAEFWANKRGGTYLGFKEEGGYQFAIDRAGETHMGTDKGAYIVGYDKEEEFEIRTTW